MRRYWSSAEDTINQQVRSLSREIQVIHCAKQDDRLLSAVLVKSQRRKVYPLFFLIKSGVRTWSSSKWRATGRLLVLSEQCVPS